jgi:hypothetical protein
MSTSSITFSMGEVASASTLMSAFNALRSQGQQVIDTLVNYRATSLIDFEQRVEALNSRRQRANRIGSPYIPVEFVTTDLLDIDQTQTSATVRADSQAVILRERPTPASAVVLQQQFSTSDGTAESLSTNNTIYRVGTSDGSIPVGTFTLQLTELLNLSVITFDFAAMPSTPAVVVSASADGVNYVAATNTSLNGDRLTAWFAPMEMMYVTVAVTPATPDTLGGSSYTFGLLDMIAAETEFQLVSDLVTLPISFQPIGANLQFSAQTDPGLVYFLNFGGAGWQEVAANSIVAIPGVAQTTLQGVGMNVAGLLNASLPAGVYAASITAIDDATGLSIPVVSSLSPTDPNVSRLTHDCLAVNGQAVNYVGPDLATSAAKLFTLTYAAGPATLGVQLRVQLSTSDRTVSPTFTGASLQEL